MVDIPDWFGWLFLGLLALQAVALVPLVRRLRASDAVLRAKARFDLLETVGSLLLFLGGLLMVTVAESWVWLLLTGLATTGAVYVAKGVHLLRTRRRPTP